jgi:hypothetical protein
VWVNEHFRSAHDEPFAALKTAQFAQSVRTA